MDLGTARGAGAWRRIAPVVPRAGSRWSADAAGASDCQSRYRLIYPRHSKRPLARRKSTEVSNSPLVGVGQADAVYLYRFTGGAVVRTRGIG